MLQYTTIRTDHSERRREAPAVVAFLVSVPMLNEARELAPSRAWWMGDNGKGTRVLSRVARSVPRLDAGEGRVGAVRLNEKRGYCSHVICNSERASSTVDHGIAASTIAA